MPRNIKIRITEGKLNEQTRKQRKLISQQKLTKAWRAWSAQLAGFENSVSVADMVKEYNRVAKKDSRPTISSEYEIRPFREGLTAWKNKVMKSPELWKLIIRQMLPMQGYETVETAKMTAFIPVFKRASVAISDQKESFGGFIGYGGAIDMFDGTTKPIYTKAVNYIVDKAARAIAPKFEAWQKANFYIMAPELKPAATNTTAGNESGNESGTPEMPVDEIVTAALEQAVELAETNPQGAIDTLTSLLVNLQNDPSPEAQALIPNIEAALETLESENPEVQASPEATEDPVETLASNTNLTPQQAQATSQSSASSGGTGQTASSGGTGQTASSGGTGQTASASTAAAPAASGYPESIATNPATMSGTTTVTKRYRIRLAHQNIKNPKGWKQSITQMQTILRKAGYDLGSYGVDGDYGPATVKAVKAFQKDNKLAKVDGIVGENTWAAMSAIAKKAAEKPAEKAIAQNPVTPKANKVYNANTVEEMVNSLRNLGSSELGFARLRGAYKNVRDKLIKVIAAEPDMRPKTRAQGGGGNLARENAQYGIGGARKIADTVFRYNPDAAKETGDSENDRTIMIADLQKLATKGLRVQYGRAKIEFESKQVFDFIKVVVNEVISNSEIAQSKEDAQAQKPQDPAPKRDLYESKSYDLNFDKWSKLWK